jgi:O-antigen ligase
MYWMLILFVVTWGAAAFGAVYEWAYQPLIAAAALLGIYGLFSRASAGRRMNTPLAIACAVVIASAAAQLIPLPHALVSAISPEADQYLRRHEVGYAVLAATGESPAHALSIDPAQTAIGLTFLIALALFLLGAGRRLGDDDVRRLAPALMAIGSALAVVGIVQKLLYNGRLYWFWTPIARSFAPFGPFVNRNHFAGWMLMALPLVTGHFIGLVMAGIRDITPGQSRVSWLAGPDAGRVLAAVLGILVMSLSLVMTLSRSAITCFVMALLLAGVAVARRSESASRRLVIIMFLAGVAAVAVWEAGLDQLAMRFVFTDREIDMRLGAWNDALDVAHRYPAAGAGLNTYGVAMYEYQTHRVEAMHFAEAHNDYLQLLAEGGVLVTVPAVVLIVVFVREVRRRFLEGADDRAGFWIRAGAVTGIVAISLQELVDFSLQIPGNAMLFVLLCVMAVRTGRRAATPTPLSLRR